jgi:hypothetical protein
MNGRSQVRFERIWAKPPFHIDFVDGTGDDLVISFSSVGHDPMRCPSPEFVATATGGTAGRRALFVMDESRSWANHPGFAPALQGTVDQISARAPIRRIATLGLSMGAFSALAAAQILPVDIVLAFCPQFSVLSGDRRWARWTDHLPDLRWPTAPLPTTGWACLFHGLEDDLQQALGFPQQSGTDHILFPDHSHASLVPHLKNRGVLHGIAEAVLAGDRRRLLRITASAGGMLRQRLYPPIR